MNPITVMMLPEKSNVCGVIFNNKKAKIESEPD
jgi:hypothetical protein